MKKYIFNIIVFIIIFLCIENKYSCANNNENTRELSNYDIYPTEMSRNDLLNSEDKYCVLEGVGFGENIYANTKIPFLNDVRIEIEPGKIYYYILKISSGAGSNTPYSLTCGWKMPFNQNKELYKKIYKLQYITQGSSDEEDYKFGYYGFNHQYNDEHGKKYGARQIALWGNWNEFVLDFVLRNKGSYEVTDDSVGAHLDRWLQGHQNNDFIYMDSQFYTKEGKILSEEAQIYADVLTNAGESPAKVDASIYKETESIDNGYITCKVKYSGIITKVLAGNKHINKIYYNGNLKSLNELPIGNRTEFTLKIPLSELGGASSIKITTYGTSTFTTLNHYFNQAAWAHQTNKRAFNQDNIKIEGNRIPYGSTILNVPQQVVKGSLTVEKKDR